MISRMTSSNLSTLFRTRLAAFVQLSIFCQTTLLGLLNFSPSRLKLALEPIDDCERFLRGAGPSETPGLEEARALRAGEGGTLVDSSEYEEEKLLIEDAEEVERADRPESTLLKLGLARSALGRRGPKKGDFGWSDGSSIRLRSTECNSRILRAIQRLILGSRISSLYSALLSKYSSTRPFVKVPSMAGPMP